MGVKGVAILAISFFVSACGMDSQGVMEVMSAAATPIDYSNPGAAFSSGFQRGINISQAIARSEERARERERYNKENHPDSETFVQNLSLYMADKLDGVLLRSLPFSTKYKGKNIVNSFQLAGSPWEVIAINESTAIIGDSITKLPGNSRGAIDIHFPKGYPVAVFTYSVYSCDDFSYQDIYGAVTYDNEYVIREHKNVDRPVKHPEKDSNGYVRTAFVCNALVYGRDGNGNKYMTKLR